MIRQLATFGAVGLAASAVHFAVAALLLAGDVPIFVANAAGFAVAFAVSYLGHHRLTFASRAGHARSMPRFLVTAGIGFAVNNGVLAALVWLTGRETSLFVAIAIGVAALVTWLLARFWAFSEG